MQLTRLALSLGVATTVIALADPEAYADADPLAFAEDAPASCPPISCHVACGGLAKAFRTCSTNNTYDGPFDHECACGEGSAASKYVDACLDCGWTVWSDYAPFLTAGLAECGKPTQPTGTTSCAAAETSSASEIESSIVESTADTTTESTSESVAQTTTESIAESSAVESTAESSAVSAAESTAVESSAVQSSAVESSAVESSAAESSTVSSVVSSSASSESSAVPTDAFAPTFAGSLNSGVPQWTIDIPATLGPWTSVSVSVSKTGLFVYTSAKASVGNATFTNDSVSFETKEQGDLQVSFGGSILDGASVLTSTAIITVITPDGKKMVKRAEQSWTLVSTITVDAASSGASSGASSAASSSASSAVSSGAVSSSAASSAITSAPFTNGTTSTATEDKQTTTVITVTSCSEDKCSEVAVTTGVTVVTTTKEGVVTEYTTYCPITTEAPKTKAPKTTVVTITSCSEDKCTKVPVTTGVTVITEKHTTYTTYCPIESTETKAKPTETKAKTVSSSDSNQTSTLVHTSTVHHLSTFEGGAAKLVTGVGAMLLSFLI